MWRWVFVGLMLAGLVGHAQKKWDGGANSNAWQDPMNWNPDGIPGALDEVILDHQWLQQDYQVQIPSGNTPVELLSLTIYPSKGQITLILPASNNALPGLKLNSAGDALTIHNLGVFINASTATSGNPLQLNGKIRIYDGGKYVHQTVRGHADLINRISDVAGTEKGIFEFDVPGGSGYTVSLTGNLFGTLAFRAKAAGGSKSYSGSGTSNLTIRGDLTIEAGASLTSTLTADILLAGNLVVDGKLNLHPATTGSAGRSLLFSGHGVAFRGMGTISTNAFFRNLTVSPNSSLVLERSCALPFESNALVCRGMLSCGTAVISGSGSFELTDGAKLMLGADSGITQTSLSGNIQTSTRTLSSKANYGFEGTLLQYSGTGLPDTVASLAINNPQHLVISKPLVIRDSLILIQGKILTDSGQLLQLLTPPDAPGMVPATRAGWEKSFIEGPFKVHINDTGTHLLPTGLGSVFAPLKLRQAAPGRRQLTIRYRAISDPGSLSPSLSALSQTGYSFRSDSLSGWLIGWRYVYADSSQYPGLSPMPAVLNDPYAPPASWRAVSGRLQPAEAGWGWLETDTAVRELQGMATGYQISATLLPLRLIRFFSRREGNGIGLYWRADQGGYPATYTIERSLDGRTFTAIGMIQAGLSQGSDHHWVDPLPREPNNYYRLFIENGGTSYRSEVVRQAFSSQKPRFYPNPATESIHIYFPERSSISYLELVNSSGAVLRRYFVNTTNCIVGVSDLPKGMYFIRFLGAGEPTVLHFTKN